MHRLQNTRRTSGAPDRLDIITAVEALPARQPAYRGRFAPSPTGPLHLGSLFTALASYLEAKSHGGQWLLRIDDADPYRTQPGAADRIQSTLEAFGLYWDEPVYFQSQQRDRYREVLETLQARGQLYACACSRRELSQTPDSNLHLVYPGYCRNRFLAFTEGTHALRIVTDHRMIRFDDRVQGPVEQAISQKVGDFVLFRRDGAVAYHLATVLDDSAQEVSDVLRGFDLLDSTPRQIFLQQVMGLSEPGYAHIPILLDSRGLKLSKQTSAAEVDVRHPGRLLHRLLTLLRQSPPNELKTACAGEILDWATIHWRLAPLQGQQQSAVTHLEPA